MSATPVLWPPYLRIFSLFGLLPFASDSKTNKFVLTHFTFAYGLIYIITTASVGLSVYSTVVKVHLTTNYYISDVNRKNDLFHITSIHLTFYLTTIALLADRHQHVNFLNRLQMFDKEIRQLVGATNCKRVKIHVCFAFGIITQAMFAISLETQRSYLSVIGRVWILFPIITHGLSMLYLIYITVILLDIRSRAIQCFKNRFKVNINAKHKTPCEIIRFIYDCDEIVCEFSKVFGWCLSLMLFRQFNFLLNGTFTLIIYYRYEFEVGVFLFAFIKIPVILFHIFPATKMVKLAQQVILLHIFYILSH